MRARYRAGNARFARSFIRPSPSPQGEFPISEAVRSGRSIRRQRCRRQRRRRIVPLAQFKKKKGFSWDSALDFNSRAVFRRCQASPPFSANTGVANFISGRPILVIHSLLLEARPLLRESRHEDGRDRAAPTRFPGTKEFSFLAGIFTSRNRKFPRPPGREKFSRGECGSPHTTHTHIYTCAHTRVPG